MERIYVVEQDTPEGFKAMNTAYYMPRVPNVGEFLNVLYDNEHVVAEVQGVQFKTADERETLVASISVRRQR